MNEKEIIARLNWFYSLELNQVELYKAQSGHMNDIYLAKTLERVAAIEQGHVDNISAEIKRRGEEPTMLGDVIFPLLGRTAGTLTGVIGPESVLKVGIELEEIAMRDYRNFILRSNDLDLFNLLWSNLIDEDLHTAWFANKLRELSSLH